MTEHINNKINPIKMNKHIIYINNNTDTIIAQLKNNMQYIYIYLYNLVKQ